ncbi:MNR2 [Candida oxycetoniae]|uniref:MNR2 n=1 Tax=Candida oxycetoniae TaxID=497107 RepID=A0AAI9WVW1_9ASCO|nr:MNR2 [Candida oxycetoniae]KAI3402635.2 MNR2 [Candida oxycetoniae]
MENSEQFAKEDGTSMMSTRPKRERYPRGGKNQSNNQSTTSLEKLINSGTYIDHRGQKDFDSSPTRSRRRVANENVFKRSERGDPSGESNTNDANNKKNSKSKSKNNSNGAYSKSMNKDKDKDKDKDNVIDKDENIRNHYYAPRPSNLPLTNRNLRHLLRCSVSSQGRNNDESSHTMFPDTVALDMDKFANEQSKLAKSHSWNDPFEDENGDIHHVQSDKDLENGDFLDNYSVNSLEFGESNPSSDHSSDSTSLDDVCYFDYNREDERREEWPNLHILEEFVKEEFEEAEKEREQEIGKPPIGYSVNFGQDVVHEQEGDKTGSPRSPKMPHASSLQSHNIDGVGPKNEEEEDVTNENIPLMDNYKTNELESLNSLNEDALRVRPTPTQPWEKSKDQIPTILRRNTSQPNQKKYSQKDGGEVCRYTYFREDLPKTIYAPTLGGLLNDDPKLSIFDKLVELFRPNSSGNKASGPGSTASQQKKQGSMSSSNLQHLRPPRIGNESPLPLSTAGGELNTDPFWLDVLDPTEEEMKVISRTFGIHPLTTEDIFLGEAREKVELFKSYYFICFTSFDIVYERRKQKAKEQEKKFNKLQEMYDSRSEQGSFYAQNVGIFQKLPRFLGNLFRKRKRAPSNFEKPETSSTVKSRTKKVREGELSPLNMYIIVFKNAVISFHFSPTPHPINVRRRARMLKDYLTVSSDWICYALIDDITDSFAPMIEAIETEVNLIEDTILRMHSGEHDDSDDSDSDSDDNASNYYHQQTKRHGRHSRHHRHHRSSHNHQRHNDGHVAAGATHDPRDNVFVWRKRSKSTVEANQNGFFRMANTKSKSKASSSSTSTTSDTGSSRILGWKRKGDLLRRIGECRKRVMSVLRLLSSKADVIKGFSKRFNDIENSSSQSEIAMYLGDIQDHIVTMSQALNHYEKLLARFHSNYLAQINIDMTKVNNDTNDVLGKITILGTIVLPINVVTGLWGMNCLVPGQDYDGLAWFWCIVGAMALFSFFAFHYARRVTGL